MMEKRLGKIFGMLLLVGFFLVVSLNFVSSVMNGGNVNITSVKRYQNFSTTFNFTVITSMINTSTTTDSNYNATLFCNNSGGAVTNVLTDANITKIITLYNGTNGNASAGNAYAILSNSSVRINTVIVSANESTIFNCSIWAENSSGGNWSYGNGLISLNTSNITFDSTPPNVSSTLIGQVNYGNYTGTVILNISANDVVIGISSAFFNITYSNGSQVNFSVATSSGGYYSVSIVTSTFEDNRYNITIHVNDTLNNINASRKISYLTFDSTPPNVSSTLIGQVNYGNYTGTVILNISANDATVGISSVFFNITYANGSRVNYSVATASGGYHSISINTETFDDNRYNITIEANDSLNNLNNSRKILYLTFDKTAPTGSYSCSPASVYSGDTVTCSCSASDATSGVNSSATSSTTNPSTADTGTFSLTCSFADMVGRTGTAGASYNVEIYSSAGGTGGGGTTTTTFSYSKTIPQTSQDFSVIQTIQTSSFSGGGLGVKERVKIKLNNVEHFVGIRAITATSAKVEVASDPVQVDLNVGDEKKMDVDGDGYYDVYLKLNKIISSKADLTINYLHELIPPSLTGGEETTGGTTGEGAEGEVPVLGLKSYWMWISLGVVVLIAAGIAFFLMKKKRR